MRRLMPLLALLLLTAACDDDDDDIEGIDGLMVEVPSHINKHRFPKRVAIVRGTVVSATGIPVHGAFVKVVVFFVEPKFRHNVFEDRCKASINHFSAVTGVNGDFLADLAVDAAVPELCVLVSVTPPTLSGLRPTIVRIESLLPALNTGFVPVPTVLVNVILTT